MPTQPHGVGIHGSGDLELVVADEPIRRRWLAGFGRLHLLVAVFRSLRGVLGALRRRGLPHFIESLITTAVIGRDQGHLAQPWVQARTIDVDATRVGIVEFNVVDAGEEALYDNGHIAAETFLATWDFEAYKARFRADPAK